MLVAYLMGCFCGAYYYGIIFKKTDLRNFGSGSLGALNAGRVLGKKDFMIVLGIDFLKGAMVVFFARQFGLRDAGLLLAMLAVVLGHIFPVQLGFKGGKGIATFFGVLAAYDAFLITIIILSFILVFFVLRQFTVSGLISIVLLPLFMAFLGYPRKEILVILLFLLIILPAHKENIKTYRGKITKSRDS